MKKPTRNLILECSLYYFLSKKLWKVGLIGEELVKIFATLEIGMLVLTCFDMNQHEFTWFAMYFHRFSKASQINGDNYMTASFTINFPHDGDVCYLGKSFKKRQNGGKIWIFLVFFQLTITLTLILAWRPIWIQYQTKFQKICIWKLTGLLNP